MTTMTEEWASLWYQCLAQNIDYSLYCGAREKGDIARCAELEARFSEISGIYEDFGALDGWPDDGMQSALWVEWFGQRMHLFMAMPRAVTDPSQYEARPGYVLVELPLQADLQSTQASVNLFLGKQYAGNGFVALPKPKYTLVEVDGRPAHGIQQVRQACRSVARSYRYDPETYEELGHQEAVVAFVRHEIDNMGWNLDPKARDELAANGQLSEQRLDSFKSMLNRCRRDFRAFAANTIRARFPDDTPFESTVLDLF